MALTLSLPFPTFSSPFIHTMKLLRIGITHGDINGISYELLIRLFQEPEILELFTPVVFGSAKIAAETARHLELQPLPFNIINDLGEDIQDGRINLLPVCNDCEPELEFGQQTEASLKAEANSLTAALEAFRDHHVDAIVTLPGQLDNDEQLHALSDFISRALGIQQGAFDWIINGNIRMLLLHPFDVSTDLGEGLAAEAFHNDVTNIYHGLRQDFGLIRPRIAVVSPVQKLHGDLAELHELGITAFGPFAGTPFAEGRWQQHYDACLFLNDNDTLHQVLRQEDADFSVGYISGMPLVLTYPLQGISYDIAGKGLANECSLRQAFFTAIDIYRKRQSYRHATHNPLEKQWIPRGRDDFKLDLTKEE